MFHPFRFHSNYFNLGSPNAFFMGKNRLRKFCPRHQKFTSPTSNFQKTEKSLKNVSKRIIDKPQSGYLHLSLQVLERQTKKRQVQIHFVISQMPKICFRRFLTVTFQRFLRNESPLQSKQWAYVQLERVVGKFYVGKNYM